MHAQSFFARRSKSTSSHTSTKSLASSVTALSAVMLTGCANLTSPAQVTTLDNSRMNWLQYDATRRGTLVYPTSKGLKSCAEPSPDAALSLVTKLEATSKPTGSEDGKDVVAKAEMNSTIADLAKRTQTVSFLREALFRLCEQSINNELSAEQLSQAYMRVLETALKVAEADKSKADEQKAKAETAKAQAEKAAEDAKLRTFQLMSSPK